MVLKCPVCPYCEEVMMRFPVETEEGFVSMWTCNCKDRIEIDIRYNQRIGLLKQRGYKKMTANEILDEINMAN